jgi:hypothetical protein
MTRLDERNIDRPLLIDGHRRRAGNTPHPERLTEPPPTDGEFMETKWAVNSDRQENSFLLLMRSSGRWFCEVAAGFPKWPQVFNLRNPTPRCASCAG